MNNLINPHIQTHHAETIDEVVRFILQLEAQSSSSQFYFRGENKDFGTNALTPGIYRGEHLKREHIIYREMQRFNDHEFTTDKTAFDKLARMQHYSCPTRMLDLSEDMFSSLFFSLDNRKEGDEAVLYVVELNEHSIKYYDSDAVSIIANLAKLPLERDGHAEAQEKSKHALWLEALGYYDNREAYNANKSLPSKGFLLHDIKEEKSYFQDLIDPKDLFRIVAVKPKLTSQRLQGQKGAFLLYGLNKEDANKPIPLITDSEQLNIDEQTHPVLSLTKIVLSPSINNDQLKRIGITKPFIYPELDKVSEHLKVSNGVEDRNR